MYKTVYIALLSLIYVNLATTSEIVEPTNKPQNNSKVVNKLGLTKEQLDQVLETNLKMARRDAGLDKPRSKRFELREK